MIYLYGGFSISFFGFLEGSYLEYCSPFHGADHMRWWRRFFWMRPALGWWTLCSIAGPKLRWPQVSGIPNPSNMANWKITHLVRRVSHISLLKLGLAEVLKSPWKFFVSSSVYCGGWWGAGASIWLVLLTNLKQCCSTPLGWQCGSWSSGEQIRTKFEWLRSAAWFYNVLLRLWKDLWLENFALGKNQQHHSGRLFHYRSISAFLSDVAMSATKENAEWIWKTRSLSAIPRCGGITTEIWAAQAEVTYLGPGMVARGPPVRINQAQGWAHSSTLETLRD